MKNEEKQPRVILGGGPWGLESSTFALGAGKFGIFSLLDLHICLRIVKILIISLVLCIKVIYAS
jgi:hypothetical protein